MKNLIEYVITTWMDLDNIMLNEISQSQKTTCRMTPVYEVPRVTRFIEGRMVLAECRAWGEAEGS